MNWLDKISSLLVGKTISSVRFLTDAEQQELGWTSKAIVITLDDGHSLFASQDDEGNDAGALFLTYKTLPVIPVF